MRWDHVGAPRTHMQRISLIFAVILASLGSAMAAEPVGEWLVADGSARIKVYNAQNGKTYTAHINLLAADVLRIEGCVLGFLCGGENWSRFRPPEEPPRRRAGPAKSPATSDVCSIISGSTG